MSGRYARFLALTVVLALSATSAATAQTQDAAELRARQLEVFEELLTRTVQEHVQSTVDAGIEEERVGDVDGDGEPDGPPSDPVVVKVGDAAGAHGLYIAGYGVLFSIQQPQISVLPRSFAVYMNEPRFAIRTAPRTEFAGPRREANLLRLQASMLQRQLGQMERMLEIQVTRDPESEAVEEISAQIDRIRQGLVQVQSQFAEEPEAPETPEPAGETRVVAPTAELAEATETEEVTAAREKAARAEAEDRQRYEFQIREPFGFYREMVDRQRSVSDVLDRNHARMRQAVNDAAIDTLAHYGAVIKGLDDDDRLSVIVLPPNPWGVGRRQERGHTAQEYVISVRYRDIRDFDAQKIDLAEFHERVRIHDRLGLELPHEEPQGD